MTRPARGEERGASRATGTRRNEPTLAEVEHARTVVADFMRLHSPNADFALPIYRRLKAEADRLRADREALEEAIGFSTGRTTVAGPGPPAGR